MEKSYRRYIKKPIHPQKKLMWLREDSFMKKIFTTLLLAIPPLQGGRAFAFPIFNDKMGHTKAKTLRVSPSLTLLGIRYVWRSHGSRITFSR